VTVNTLYHGATRWWQGLLLFLVWCLTGCESLYQSYTFTESLQVTFPVQVTDDEVWISSVPAGADVYIQPYYPEQVPSHATDPEAYRGKTPVRFSLPPGSYWLEIALDAEAFDAYFLPPYDNAQFEQEGAASEALLFRPFAPGEKRRVLRYYRLEKQAAQGQTLIALFHPRGEPLERVVALYPQLEQYQFVPQELLDLLQRAQIPQDVQERFLFLMRRGGKAFWSAQEDYSVSLELRQDVVQGRIIALYTGVTLPDPLLPDGGGL
jgi:hypothetical protein